MKFIGKTSEFLSSLLPSTFIATTTIGIIVSIFLFVTEKIFLGSIVVVVVIIHTIFYLLFKKKENKTSIQATELREIIDLSPVGIYTINKKGFIETYNPAMMKISGISDAEETIGKNVFDAEQYKKNGLDKLLRAAIDGVPFEIEVEITSSLAKHKRTWRHYYGVPIKNSQNDIEHVLVMVEDVTNQKNLEKQVKEYGTELEEKISKRTRELGEKLDELQRFQRLTVDRELKMVELKQQIERMRIKIEELGEHIETT